MAPKHKNKNSWEDLNYIKRKNKKQKTLKKLKKLAGEVDNPVEACEKPIVSRSPTYSIALPGSILDNAQTPELRSYLAGQIARAACIFQIDEIIVFNDYNGAENETDTEAGFVVRNNMKSCKQLATILEYLECPQYLRKHLFPIQNSLKYAGLLNPLDAPHHFRKDDDVLFREGVVLTLPPKPGQGSYVDVGLDQPVVIDRVLEPYYRVTVKLNPKQPDSKKRKGTVVSPTTPTNETGKYWGYRVRVAGSFNEVFTQTSFSSDYDLTIGTSDKGISIDELKIQETSYQHCLVVFGGLQGLELALENDKKLDINDVSLLFDYYVNTCPKQGCRTVRTEEAVLISLAEFRTKLNRKSTNIIPSSM